jgi:hypothetical protein
MTAPIATYIQLPIDSSNAGKKVRAESKVVGADTVLEQFVVPVHALTVVGKYWFSCAQQSVSATSQDGQSTGFFWLQNPSTSTVTAIIHRISADANCGAASAAPTAPLLRFTKFTFTGTASSGTVSPLKAQTSGVNNQMLVQSGVTGMTPTLVAPIGHFSIPSILTAVGLVYGQKDVLADSPDRFTRGHAVEIAPGEGLVVYQATAGSTSDPRRFAFTISWIEVDLS